MAASNDLTEYEREERAAAAHKREMEKIAAQERVARIQADAEVKKTRAQNRPISIGVVAGMLVLLAIIGGMTYGCTLPPDPLDKSGKEIEQQREQTCIEAGGGWVPADMTTGTDETGMCVFPGERKPSS